MSVYVDRRLDLDAMLWLIPDVLKPHSTNEQINEFLRDAAALAFDRDKVLEEISKATGKPVAWLRKELVALLPDELSPTSTGEDIRWVLEQIATLDPIEHDPILNAVAKATGRPINSLRKALGKQEKAAPQATPDEDLVEDQIATKAWKERFNTGEKAGDRLVYTAGSFYAYTGTHWRMLDDAVLDRTLITISDELFEELPGRSRVVAGAHAQLRARAAKTDFFDLRGEGKPLINCANGTLVVGDDGSVTLREHRTADALLYGLPVAYDPGATCPEFDRMLAGITAPVDEQGKLIEQPSAKQLAEAAEQRRHLEELMGYAIYGRRPLKAFTIWHGAGDNGKSTLFRIWSEVVGQPAVASLRIHKIEENRFVLSHLPAKLLLVDDDVKKGVKLPDGLLKQISERKLITTETKGGAHFEFVARVFVALLCNTLPELDDGGRAIASRAHLVPFRRSFAPEEQDRHLAERIIASELPGVLNVLLAGLRRVLQRQSFDEPDACLELKARWIGAATTLESWIEDRCELGVGGPTAVDGLRKDYDRWCHENGHQRVGLAQRWFSKAIIEHAKEKGGTVARHKGAGGTRMLTGIAFKPLDE